MYNIKTIIIILKGSSFTPNNVRDKVSGMKQK